MSTDIQTDEQVVDNVCWSSVENKYEGTACYTRAGKKLQNIIFASDHGFLNVSHTLSSTLTAPDTPPTYFFTEIPRHYC